MLEEIVQRAASAAASAIALHWTDAGAGWGGGRRRAQEKLSAPLVFPLSNIDPHLTSDGNQALSHGHRRLHWIGGRDDGNADTMLSMNGNIGSSGTHFAL